MIAIDRVPLECDVLVVGGGIGGLMAAISAADHGATVIVAEKANTKRSGSGATGNDHFQCYIPEVHGDDMEPILREMNESLTGGLLDQHLTALYLQQSFERVKDWEKWGIPMKPHGNWEFNGHAMPGRPRIFLKYAGANQKLVLTTEALKRGVILKNKLPITEFITNDAGAVIGAIGIDISNDDPEIKVFRAKSVIVTTGNTSRLYPPKTPGWMFNTANCPSCTGTGRIAAYKAGAKLVNLEMPYTHAGPKYFARCGKATWIGVLKDIAGKPVGPFVTKPSKELGDITADIWNGVFAAKNKAGQSVYMDCSETTEEDLQYMMWGLRNEGDTSLLDCMETEGIDVRKHMVEFQQYEPILIGRGIQINEQAQSNVPGLYAAGDEVGNFRADIGGACVFGHIAGQHAALRASNITGQERAEDSPLVLEKQNFYSELLSRQDGASWKEANVAVQQLMNDYAGLEVRSETLFQAGLKYIRDLKKKAYSTVCCRNSHELMRCLESLDLIDIGELIMLTANERKECRGKHNRIDHPFTNPLYNNKFITIQQRNREPHIEWRDKM
ncbi:MAG TPA: FAD-binding protein [Negativicutes bacterium]|jgi:succinate dehydrogenase/fumarate reductase flavoprotein subunit